MRWLLRLYPSAWRARYGDEFAALLDEQPLTFQLVVDVLAGAIDARVEPQLKAAITATPPSKGVKTMASMMKLTCSGYGPNVTRRDRRLAAAVTVGGSLLLALAWMYLRFRVRDNAYVDAFLGMTFTAPMLLAMPFTSLKGRTVKSQVLFVGSGLLVLTAIFLVTGFIASRI